MSGVQARASDRRPARRRRQLFLLGLFAVVVAGHDLTYLVGFGAGGWATAQAAMGHGGYWHVAVTAAAASSATIGLVAVATMLFLRRHLAAIGGASPATTWRAYRAPILTAWPRLLLGALLVFAVQENLEHLGTHPGHLPGVSLLWSAEHAAAIPIFGIVSLLVAGIGSIASVRLGGLVAAIRSVEAGIRRPPASIAWPWQGEIPAPRERLASPQLSRAPPS